VLLGLVLTGPVVAQAQQPEPDRPRGERREVIIPESEWSRDQGPTYQYRYGRDDDDDAIREYRRWAPRYRCDNSDRNCDRRVREIEREEARFRREAREREADFERDMAERERRFRAKELDRWQKHRREMADRWGQRWGDRYRDRDGDRNRW
jgi:hypothetical protein